MAPRTLSASGIDWGPSAGSAVRTSVATTRRRPNAILAWTPPTRSSVQYDGWDMRARERARTRRVDRPLGSSSYLYTSPQWEGGDAGGDANRQLRSDHLERQGLVGRRRIGHEG